jgi:hypothetical protein
MWVVNFTPRPVYLLRKGPGTYCVEGYVGDVEKRKVLNLPKTDPSLAQYIARRYTDCAIQDNNNNNNMVIKNDK